LTAGLFLERGANGSVADLERAFDLVVQTEPLEKRLADARCRDRQEALALGLLSEAEGSQLQEAEEAVARVLAVDAFAAEELGEMNFSPDSKPHEEGKRQ
jgi:acyl-CoA dehydrogenase